MKVAGRYFPEEYRAFCHGALSACVERFGGINSISLLDIDEHEGKLYPDRLAIPLFSRRGTSSDRPLFSSPLRFYRESENGANISFVPEYADLLPFGFTSKQYSFLMRENSIAVKLEPESSDKSVFCTVSKMHFMTGIFPSMKNQLSGSASNIQWLPFKYRGEDFKQDLPFKDTPLEMAMPEITWLKSKGVLQIVWDLKWEDHAKKLFMCIAADAPIEASEHDALWRLTFKSAGKSCAFGFGIAYTAKEALKRSYESCVGFDSEMKMELELQTFPDAIAMEVESIPQASEFTRVFPAFQHNMMLAKTEHETAIRAATDKFGYFCMWDQVYPTRDFLICGTPENAKRSLRYLCGYPGMKYSSWISMHIIITMNEYLAFVDDSEFLAEIYPDLREFFRFTKGFRHRETGLVKDSLSVGVDVSAELGLSGLFYASCINAWWYDACRALENMARRQNDTETAEECAEITARIEAYYEKIFYVREQGYLRSAVMEDLGVPMIDTFQNTSTLGADYIHGYYLFRHIFSELASYQATKLYHPIGHLAVSYDSAIPCDMWKAVHMNMHYGHECKTARAGDQVREAVRVMEGYFRVFEKYQTAVETFNLTGIAGNSVQTSNWQTFSATGAMQALIHGIIGIEWHQGGLCYIPAEFTGKHNLRNLHFRNTVYSFRIKGEGPFAMLSVNGEKLDGTLQIPADFKSTSGYVDCELEHMREAPSRPVLLMAVDLPVVGLKSLPESLRFEAGSLCHAPVGIYSPAKPELQINGQKHSYEWNEKTNTLWFDVLFRKGDIIEIKIHA